MRKIKTNPNRFKFLDDVVIIDNVNEKSTKSSLIDELNKRPDVIFAVALPKPQIPISPDPPA